MQTYNIFTNEQDSLPQGKADFLLAASNAEASKGEEIVQLLPTLNAELITNEKVFSIELSDTPEVLLTPAVVTRAVHNLNPFSSIEVLNLGLLSTPQNCTCHNFDIPASGVSIDAKAIFKKGMNAGESYELKGNYLILADSSSATTEYEEIVKALYSVDEDTDKFEKLSLVGDNTIMFCAGFIMTASRRFHIVLSGGVQMATCLLVADALREDVLMRVKNDNITLATTAREVNNKNSNLKHILSQLSYKAHAIYTSFSFENTTIDMLKEYDEGEVKEGLCAGATLAYAHANKINNEQLLDSIEYIIYTI